MIEKRMEKTKEEIQREEIAKMVTEFTKLLVLSQQQQQQQQHPPFVYATSNTNNVPCLGPACPPPTPTCGGLNPCPPVTNCGGTTPCPEPIPPAIQALLPSGSSKPLITTTPTTVMTQPFLPGYFGYNLPTAPTTKTVKKEEDDDESKEQDDEEKKEKDDEDEPEDDDEGMHESPPPSYLI